MSTTISTIIASLAARGFSTDIVDATTVTAWTEVEGRHSTDIVSITVEQDEDGDDVYIVAPYGIDDRSHSSTGEFYTLPRIVEHVVMLDTRSLDTIRRKYEMA